MNAPTAANGASASPAALVLDDAIERVAVRVVELLADRLPTPPAGSPWLNVDEAAEYLRCPRKRIYDLTSQSRLPVHRDGSRLLFRREELDEYVFTRTAVGHDTR